MSSLINVLKYGRVQELDHSRKCLLKEKQNEHIKFSLNMRGDAVQQ